MINKETITQSLKGVMSDRPILWLAVAQIAVGIVYLIVVGLSVHASDVTVYTRYTAFGEAHFYKSQWQYLLLFVLFGLIVTITHTGLLLKLHHLGRRQTAAFIGWIGISVLVIACVYTLAVISLGRAA